MSYTINPTVSNAGLLTVENGNSLSKTPLHGDVKGKDIGGLYDASRMYKSPDLNKNELSVSIKITSYLPTASNNGCSGADLS